MVSLKKYIPGYVTATTVISLGGFLNGFDTGSIGAVTEMEQFKSTIGDLSPILRGFTVSLIMLTGAFPSFFAGQLADKFGRLQIVMAGALLFVLGVLHCRVVRIICLCSLWDEACVDLDRDCG